MAEKRGSRLWLWLLLGAAVLGVAIKLGLGNGRIHWYQLRYFTTLSNIAAGIYALLALARGRSRVSSLLHGTALMGTLVTGVVYHLLLRSIFGGQVLFTRDWMGNQLVHTAVPLFVALDWLLFAPKGRFGPGDPLGWTLFPVTYFGATVLIAKLGLCFPHSNTPYPYPFLDVWALGWDTVIRNVVLLAGAYLAVGAGIAAADRAMNKQTDVVDR